MNAVLIKQESLRSETRAGSPGGRERLTWAVSDGAAAPLLAGFADWGDALAPPKTLHYDEVILVLSGTFGVRLDDGSVLQGAAGDVITIGKGCTVRYFGRDARLFFVTTPEADPCA